MKKIVKALVVTLVAIAMILPLQTVSQALGQGDYVDMPPDGYWSHAALKVAVENGLLTGISGKLMPQEILTRAQLAAILVRAFGASAMADISGYSDVAKSDWCYGDIAKAVKMGVLEGSGGRLRPNDMISRQETFVILARVFKLRGGSDDILSKFLDDEKLASWATESTATLVDGGYVQGGDGELYPMSNISREEFAQILYKILQNYITAAGTYTVVGAGGVMINCPGVSLKDVTVSGDLYIGDGVGSGTVTLDHVTVTGRLVIRGGGQDSINIMNQSRVGSIIVTKKADGPIHIFCENGSTADVVQIDDGSDKVTIEGVYKVVMIDSDTPVILKNASIATVVVGAPAAGVSVESGTVKLMQVTPTAKLAKIDIMTGARVDHLDSAAPGVVIGGGGTLTVANVSGDNTSDNTTGTMLTVAKGTKGATQNGMAIDATNGATVKTGARAVLGGGVPLGGGGTPSGGGTVSFTASINSSTANDVATLGLVGTSVSSGRDSVATGELAGGKIAIKSVGAGTAIITVSDGSTHQATIQVTVSATGAITIGTITKYVAAVSFVPSTNSNTANDVATLGLVGTMVSSSMDSVATGELAGGKIAIKSVGAGTAIITVSDGSAHQATIQVTVSATGAITIGTIIKFGVTTYSALMAAQNDSAVTAIDVTGGFDISTTTTITKNVKIASGVTLTLKAPLSVASVLTVDGAIDIAYNGRLQIHGGTLAGTGRVIGEDVSVSTVYYADGTSQAGEITLANVPKVTWTAETYGDIGLQNALGKGEKAISLLFDGETPFAGANDVTLQTDVDLEALWVNPDVRLTITSNKSLKVSQGFLYSDVHPGNFAKLNVDSGCTLIILGHMTIDPNMNIFVRGTLDNEGVITTADGTQNPGEIHFEPSGTLLNNGKIENHVQVVVHDWYPTNGSGGAGTAVITNNGTVEMKDITYVANVYSEAQLSNAVSATFNGEPYAVIYLRRDITLTSNLTVHSVLEVTQSVSLMIPAESTLTLAVGGGIYNEGTVLVAGKLTVADFGAFVHNLHTIQIGGVVTNTGTLYTDVNSELTNTGTIDNTGSIVLHGGTFDNSAMAATVKTDKGRFEAEPGVTLLDHKVLGWRGKDDVTSKPRLSLEAMANTTVDIKLFYNDSIKAQLDKDGSTWTALNPTGSVTIGPALCPLAALALFDSNADGAYDWFRIIYGAATGVGAIEIQYQSAGDSIDCLVPVRVS